MDFSQMDSLNDLTVTFHDSKLTCWKPFYYVHMVCAYGVTIAGFLAFITRLFDVIKPLHFFMGRLYIIFMIWAMGSSLVIHNTGLPTGVLWSFLWVGVGLSIGYIAIGFHQKGILVRKPNKPASSPQKWNRWSEIFWRIVSWKGLHGVMMLLSWINVAGRTFVTKPEDFDCYTYAVYKPGYTGKNFTPGPMIGNLTLVPTMSASYPRTPWAYREGAWAVIMSVAPVAAGIVIAVVYQLITLRRPKGEMVETSEEQKSVHESL